MRSKAKIRREREARVEEAAVDVMYYAEQWSLNGCTFHDLKCRRRNLLAAAREYGAAMRALGNGVR